MKIVSVSDLHGNLIDIEECDVLTISGDIIPCEIQRDLFQSWWWFNNIFLKWCDSQPCKKVIFIAGNHDFFLQGEDPFEVGKVQYLFDSGCEYEGIKFWGSPWITGLPYWAFNVSEHEQKNKFMNIPKNTDVLLTHTPPFDVQDIAKVDWKQGNPVDYGSTELTKIIPLKKPRFVLSGHIHSGNHDMVKLGDSTLFNVSILDETYSVYYKPVSIYL